MTLLQLLDEGLDVGRDCFFRGVLLWLRLFGVPGKWDDGVCGGDGDDVHRSSSLAFAGAFHARCGMYVHAERHRAKAG